MYFQEASRGHQHEAAGVPGEVPAQVTPQEQERPQGLCRHVRPRRAAEPYTRPRQIYSNHIL